MSKDACRLTAAMGTPLTETESLHVEGFERHLDDVCEAGIDAVLVAGSMGNMQLLADETYRDLTGRVSDLAAGRCELFVGAGDASFARTRDRIHWLNRHRYDGVALLTPYFKPFSQDELIAYYSALADESRWPIFLYDLPARTGVALEARTVLRLADHPNIAGIKCSGPLGLARRLYEQRPTGFRLQFAQPHLLDVLIQGGFSEHVDGMYALAPRWTVAIRDAVEAGQSQQARAIQQDLSSLLELLLGYGTMPAFTALMNARGVPGCFAPKPTASLTPEAQSELLNHPLVANLVKTDSACPTAARG